MGEVKRSDSKGNINNLLNDIKGIVNDNKETLDGLKAIKQKNEQQAKTKRRVDIPSVISGFKKSEIDIPHKRAKGGERESEINKRNKKLILPESKEPEPDPLLNSLPVIEAGTVGTDESAPPPASPVPAGPHRIPRRDKSEERRRDRRDKSAERKKRMDAIRQKSIERKKERERPTKEVPVREDRSPRRGRESRRREPEKRPEEESKPEPPSRRSRPIPAVLRDNERPGRGRRSRPSRGDEPDGLPTVEVGSGPTEHAEPPAPDPPTRLSSISRGRTPSGHSDHSGHGHLFRIRKHSEGSVEIFPDYIEEHKIFSEYKIPSLSSSIENIDVSSRPGVSPGLSLPRSTTSRWYSKADCSSYSRQSSSMKRRIVLERCPHCQDTDSPPEIEIRICKRSARCGKFRSQDDIHIIPQESLNLESKPDPPARAASLNRIPPKHTTNYETPLSPTHRVYSPTHRAQSPSEREMERLSSRLEMLKREVTSVIKDCEDDVPLHVRITDRPTSPYHPDKTPYYRARYHSAPQSPTGQNDATTSTTELPAVYHPAREEASAVPETVPEHKEIFPEVLLLSTQSIEIPDDVGTPVTDQLELEVESLTENLAPELQSHFVPVQNSAPESYDEVYDPECDLGVNGDPNSRPKREEELLTPPPLPDRGPGPQPDITLRGDNLYDPYHIGTTFVVLSRQNHGRFKFSNPLDPNLSAPGVTSKPSTPISIPKPSTPVSTPLRGSPLPVQNGSLTGSSPKSVPRSEAAEVPEITPVVSAPVSSAPPPATPPPASPKLITTSTRRPLYQPKSLNGSLMSLSSPSKQDIDLDTTPSKLVEIPATPVETAPTPVEIPPTPVQNGSEPPPLPARNPGMMSPEKRRGFQRPVKEPVYREVAVDAPDRPILPERKHTLQEQQKNSASREFHLQTIMDVEKPGKIDTWSGAMPPAQTRGGVVLRPFSPHSENSLRRTMPHVKLLGEEWKELAQKLGYENSHIASFSRDYPDPGQALLDHWSRLPESRLDELLRHLKSMDLWKTADTLDKTFDNTNV